MNRALAFVLMAAVTVCLLAIAGCKSNPAVKWTGDVKDFSYKTFDGAEHKISEYAGQPLVVNFWAAWCPPCKAELPDFQKVYHENKGKFVFLSIAVDEQEDPKGYVKQNGFDWNFGIDVDGSETYGVTAIPQTLFIDSKGFIKQRFEGMRSGEEFAAALQSIMAGPASV